MNTTSKKLVAEKIISIKGISKSWVVFGAVLSFRVLLGVPLFSFYIIAVIFFPFFFFFLLLLTEVGSYKVKVLPPLIYFSENKKLIWFLEKDSIKKLLTRCRSLL